MFRVRGVTNHMFSPACTRRGPDPAAPADAHRPAAGPHAGVQGPRGAAAAHHEAPVRHPHPAQAAPQLVVSPSHPGPTRLLFQEAWGVGAAMDRQGGWAF